MFEMDYYVNDFSSSPWWRVEEQKLVNCIEVLFIAVIGIQNGV
jgi:hypothetical protein